MIKGLFNRLLKKSKRAQYVMLNWFQHLVKSMSYETLNQVQGDKEAFFQQPNKFLKSNCEELRTTNYELKTMNSKGFTLIEIIIVIVILSIVSAITIYFLINSLRIYTMIVYQKNLFDEGKLALERMCRDIRDANSITLPAAGASGNLITFIRTNATGPSQDVANETITFQLNVAVSTLEKVKTSPVDTVALAANVSSFTVTRGAGGNEEITLFLTLSLATGERVTLQTKVYPKNLAKSTTYKNFYQNWKEERST